MQASTYRIGGEAQPLVVIDDFAADPDALRRAAAAAIFEPGRHHYPGVRADLPPAYVDAQLPSITEVAASVFGRTGVVTVVDASFSIVTHAPAALTLPQRLPHSDAFSPKRLALVHFLALQESSGTAFFRHRSTGFETIDETRRPIYFGQLEAELRHRGQPAAGYIAGDTGLFERIWLAEARYNRALLYHSWNLHSGAIASGAMLSPDPAAGRLTVTMFLSVD